METLSVRVPQKTFDATSPRPDVVLSAEGENILIRTEAEYTDPLSQPYIRISKCEFQKVIRALFPEPAFDFTDWWKSYYPPLKPWYPGPVTNLPYTGI